LQGAQDARVGAVERLPGRFFHIFRYRQSIFDAFYCFTMDWKSLKPELESTFRAFSPMFE
jgi:hypothetical protein